MRRVCGGDQRSGLERIMELSLWLIVLCFEHEKKDNDKFKYHVINPVTVISICS